MALAYWQFALDVPMPGPFDYLAPAGFDPALDPVGLRALLPWGTGKRVGIVVGTSAQSGVAVQRIRPVEGLLTDLSALPRSWLELARFASAYYQASLGAIALPALPQALRQASRYAAAKALAVGPVARARKAWPPPALAQASSGLPELTSDQRNALERLTLDAGFRAHLLYGVTGSGKTEVYLRAIERILRRSPTAQALLLVPEIALTPQFVRLLCARFPEWPPAVLHSAVPEAQRCAAWVAAHEGRARLVVGTRMAVWASMPHCALIVVDEEHDPSYRQQEGVRWSGRDLAVARARIEQIPVILGSATPALETWQNAGLGRYTRIDLPRRAAAQARLPSVRLIDTTRVQTDEGLSAEAITAIESRLARGEQSLVYLNRRGYAPVLSCQACGWVANCPHCSVTLALHGRPTEPAPPLARPDGQGVRKVAPARADLPAGSTPRAWRLICHHCGHAGNVPRACPDCGEVDLAPLGRGTQRLEETIRARFAGARVLRIDRDATRLRGATETLLASVHRGEVDILVGTQMLAKGHDFARLTLVVVLGADLGLYSHDFRAPERLFATLLQVAGRAGRAEQPGEVLIQTRWPGHPLFAALRRQDYPAFAQQQLHERQGARLPPFGHQALLCADARQAHQAIAFLAAAKALVEPGPARVAPILIAEPVPMPLARLAGRERAQLLVESSSRSALQAMLGQWLPALRALALAHSRVHWHLEVDPLAI
jgi:primosomal protein N' (replication factor Y)